MSVQTSDYSNMGRHLTEADIGQQVLRVSPYRKKDTSNCFQNGENPKTVALRFEGIIKGYLHFSYEQQGQQTKRFLSANWNDGAWTTVNELMKQLQAK